MRSARNVSESPAPYHVFCERYQPQRQSPPTPDFIISINWPAVVGGGLLLGSIAGLAWFFWTLI